MTVSLRPRCVACVARSVLGANSSSGTFARFWMLPASLLPEVRRIDQQVDESVRRIVNRILNARPEFLDRTIELLRSMKLEEIWWMTTTRRRTSSFWLDRLPNHKPQESSFPPFAEQLALPPRNEAALGAFIVRDRDILEKVVVEQELSKIGAQIVTIATLREVIRSPRRWVLGVPGSFKVSSAVGKRGRPLRTRAFNLGLSGQRKRIGCHDSRDVEKCTKTADTRGLATTSHASEPQLAGKTSQIAI